MSEQWSKYVCEYQYDGATWSVEFPARSHQEAAARLRCMGMNGEVRWITSSKGDE